VDTGSEKDMRQRKKVKKVERIPVQLNRDTL